MIARFEALAREGRGNAPSAAASTSPPAPRVSCVYFSLFGSGLAGLGCHAGSARTSMAARDRLRGPS